MKKELDRPDKPDIIKLNPKITADLNRLTREVVEFQNLLFMKQDQVNSICKAVQNILGKEGEYILSRDNKILVEKSKPKDNDKQDK